jgi:hypothetical protein
MQQNSLSVYEGSTQFGICSATNLVSVICSVALSHGDGDFPHRSDLVMVTVMADGDGRW